MISVRGHYDGKVIVPDGPLELPQGVPLVISIALGNTEHVPPSPAPARWHWMQAAVLPQNPEINVGDEVIRQRRQG